MCGWINIWKWVVSEKIDDVKKQNEGKREIKRWKMKIFILNWRWQLAAGNLSAGSENMKGNRFGKTKKNSVMSLKKFFKTSEIKIDFSLAWIKKNFQKETKKARERGRKLLLNAIN